MSSSVVTSPPQLPSSRGLSHMKSQSLVGISLPPSQAPSNISSTTSVPLGSSHRPTAGLDGVVISQTHSPTPTSTTSNQIYTNPSTSNAFNHATDNSVPVSNSTYDPWASADFSFFESAPTPPKPKPAPFSAPAIAQTPKPRTRSVTFASTRAAAPPQASPRGSGKTRQELEQDRIVASIIKGLPDLSYMLRR